MEQPPSFINSAFSSYVCRLKKALYGLKQAPRAWFDQLGTFLLSMGFFCSTANPSLFVGHSSHDTLLLLYVDDMVLTGKNPIYLDTFIDQLGKEFAIKDSYTTSLEYKYTLSLMPYFLARPNMHVVYLSMDRWLVVELSNPMAAKVGPNLSNVDLFPDTTHYRSMLVHCNISNLPGQTSLSVLTFYAHSCMHQLWTIIKLISGSFVLLVGH